MTKRGIRALELYTHRWQRRLELVGWRIKLVMHHGPEVPVEIAEEEGRSGVLKCWRPKRIAEIHVADADPDTTPQFVVRHELGHLLLIEMDRASGRLEDSVGSETWEIVRGEYVDAEEVAVNRLARALGELDDGE